MTHELTEEKRTALAEILETVARDGLPGPRDLDVALDAICCTIFDVGQPKATPEYDWWPDSGPAGKMHLIALPTWKRNDEATWTRLSLVTHPPVPEIVIATWTDDQVKEADLWALSTHYSASDNDDVIVPPRPAFLPA